MFIKLLFFSDIERFDLLLYIYIYKISSPIEVTI